MSMIKGNISETKLEQLISESIAEVLQEDFDNMWFEGVASILRQDPSRLSDDELVKCIKYLSTHADEYNFSKEDQIKFDSFWDEHKRRQ